MDVAGKAHVRIGAREVTPTVMVERRPVDVAVARLQNVLHTRRKIREVAGAEMLASQPTRVLWLGARGSGESIGAGATIYQALMKMFVGDELEQKAAPDAIATAGGATVCHAPDLWVGDASANRRPGEFGAYRRRSA